MTSNETESRWVPTVSAMIQHITCFIFLQTRKINADGSEPASHWKRRHSEAHAKRQLLLLQISNPPTPTLQHDHPCHKHKHKPRDKASTCCRPKKN